MAQTVLDLRLPENQIERFTGIDVSGLEGSALIRLGLPNATNTIALKRFFRSGAKIRQNRDSREEFHDGEGETL